MDKPKAKKIYLILDSSDDTFMEKNSLEGAIEQAKVFVDGGSTKIDDLKIVEGECWCLAIDKIKLSEDC